MDAEKPPAVAADPNADDPVGQARALVDARFPHALGSLLGGSAEQGRATAGSDLDVVVLLPETAPGGTETGRREVVRHEGRLAELFVHTPADAPRHFARDRGLRRGTVLFLYDQGRILADPHGHVSLLRERARALLEAGPPPLDGAERERARYVLTCFLDDLVDASAGGSPDEPGERGGPEKRGGPGEPGGPGERYEQLALAGFALREAAHLLTAHHGCWTGIGKWLPRRLLAADPERGGALLEGHRAVAERADAGPLAAAVEEVLALCGGPLREGYTQPWGT